MYLLFICFSYMSFIKPEILVLFFGETVSQSFWLNKNIKSVSYDKIKFVTLITKHDYVNLAHSTCGLPESVNNRLGKSMQNTLTLVITYFNMSPPVGAVEQFTTS